MLKVKNLLKGFDKEENIKVCITDRGRCIEVCFIGKVKDFKESEPVLMEYNVTKIQYKDLDNEGNLIGYSIEIC